MKKGFTLIELLAVIVILAVLALIATPIVLNIIDDSKKNATLRSSENYIKAIEFSIAKSVMENKRLSDGTYNVMSNGNICLGTLTGATCDNELIVEVAGETPESGTVTIKSRKIDSYEFTYASGFVVVNGEISEDGNLTLAQFILKQAKDNNYYNTTAINFSNITQEGEYGLYQMTDNQGISYYFRGDTENNYVKFSGKDIDSGYYIYIDVFWTGIISKTGFVFESEEECVNSSIYSSLEVNSGPECRFEETPMKYTNYWRIVRINGDGTIRLVYDGTELKHNGENRDARLGEDYHVDHYLDLNAWYDQNIKKYESFIASSYTCLDEGYYDTCGIEECYLFKSYQRTFDTFSPVLECQLESQSSKIMGLSIDEVMLSGMTSNNSNTSNYLYTGHDFRTYSLCFEDLYCGVDEEGNIAGLNSYNEDDQLENIRPVINLKADVKFTGDGTYDNPYVIITN